MDDSSRIHRSLGRYQLLVAIARGGMGEVWLGRLQGARGFNKLVAVKTLLPNVAEGQRFESMLTEEARIASLIQHANVVHTIELGEEPGLLYLVMEWVDGEPLGFLVERAEQRGLMPITVATNLVAQVLAGLHAAHELSDDNGPLGVVHRDVSPHNILVTYDGVAKLLDFGVAKATQQTTGNTEAGEIKGKFSYMAPEQVLGGEVDRRCDVFATGIVLYLLSTRRHPFKRHNTGAIVHAITSDEPVQPPSQLVEGYPAELERVVLKALEKDRDRRFSSAEEMRLALRRALPEAFTDAGQAELRDFMQQAVGDRRAGRREAVRRAQLAADARDIETGARRALQASGQSGSSLGAIAISQPAPADVSPIVPAVTGAAPSGTSLKKPRSRARWVPLAAAAISVLALSGALAPRLLAPAGEDAGVSAGAPLPAAAAAPSALPATEAAPPPPVAAPSSVATASSISEPPRAPVPARSPASAPKPPPQPPKPAPAKPAAKRSSPSEDLLAPDYAR